MDPMPPAVFRCGSGPSIRKGAALFELFVVACIASRACEYVTVPAAYASRPACERQAAIIAGMVRGRHADAGRALVYEFTCTPTSRLRPVETAEVQPPSPDR